MHCACLLLASSAHTFFEFVGRCYSFFFYEIELHAVCFLACCASVLLSSFYRVLVSYMHVECASFSCVFLSLSGVCAVFLVSYISHAVCSIRTCFRDCGTLVVNYVLTVHVFLSLWGCFFTGYLLGCSVQCAQYVHVFEFRGLLCTHLLVSYKCESTVLGCFPYMCVVSV